MREINCNLCNFCQTSEVNGKKEICLWGKGNPISSIMIVGAYPNNEDIINGEIGNSAADKYLISTIESFGYLMDNLYFTNAVKCKPPLPNKPSKNEIEACNVYLKEEIKSVSPKLIIALGNNALEALTGKTEISKNRGQFIWSYDYKCYIFPTFNPSAILKSVSYDSMFKEDIKKALDIGFSQKMDEMINSKPNEEIKHITILTIEKFLKLKEILLSSPFHSLDIESTGFKFLTDDILCISASWEVGKAAVIPLLGRYKSEIWPPQEKEIILQGVKEIIENSKKILHNGKFDLKFFIKSGCDVQKVLKTFFYDTILGRSLTNEESRKGLEFIAAECSPFGGYEKEIDKAREQVLAEMNLEIKVKNDKTKLDKKLAKEICKSEDLLPLLKKDDIGYDMIPTEILWKYAAIDADVTFRGYLQQQPLLAKDGLLTYMDRLSMAQNRVLVQMELNGIGVDKEILDRNIIQLQKEKEEIYEELRKEAYIQKVEEEIFKIESEVIGKRWDALQYRDCSREDYIIKYTKKVKFNVESSRHKSILFLDILKAKAVGKSKITGNAKTDADALEEWSKQFPIASKIKDYMSLSKFLSNFLIAIRDRIDIDGRLRTDYQQYKTVTGRLASNNPNLQNLPERKNGYCDPKIVKEIFIASPGWVICKADYRQLEFRIMQQFAQDPILMEDLRSGLDIHRKIASNAYGVPESEVTKIQRHISKQIVFGLLYGRGAKSVALDLGITPEEAKVIISYFFHLYPNVKKWMDEQKEITRQRGYSLNYFGRRRRLTLMQQYAGQNTYNLPSEIGMKIAEQERQCLNFPPSSTAADVTGLAMHRLQTKIYQNNYPARLMLQIHDAIVCEARKDFYEEYCYIKREEMTRPFGGMTVPLEIEMEVGENYARVEPFKYKD